MATAEALAGPGPSLAEDALQWARFASATQASEFCQAWLPLQCRMIPGVLAGLLLLDDGRGSFALAAAWPPEAETRSADPGDLVAAARQALRDRRGVVLRTGANEAHVAYPVEAAGTLWGVVAVNAGARPHSAVGEVLRRLTWGAGWLETLFHRRQAEADRVRIAHARTALELVSAAAAAPGAFGAATVLASEMAVRAACRRVAVGTLRRGRIRLAALSHSASLAQRRRLSESLANAMEEAVDQSATVGFPPHKGAETRVASAHRDHVRDARLGSVLSVVLPARGEAAGVMTLERDGSEPFDPATVALCEAVADLAGPVLALQRELDRPLTGRLVRAAGRVRRVLIGPRHPAAKLAAVAVVALAVWLSVATGPFRITGKATVEGQMQQALAAPYDGFIAAAPHRAGDVVAEGDVVAVLDTREQDLEALHSESQREEARLKAQEAEGKHDQAEAAVQMAHAAEADAELAVMRNKIAHASLRAPFPGLIVSGDLSQKIGTPAEKGKTLFEVAPLDRYRVVLEVDERDLRHVHPGQPGWLVLNSLPTDTMAFDVTRIVPVAEAQEGKNVFRVEGRLRERDDRLRPGMEGVAKVDAGVEKRAWIWSRPIVNWLRLTVWKWWP